MIAVIQAGVIRGGMTSVLVVAGLLALVALERFGRSAVCVQCGGRGAHRDSCPFEKDDR